MLKALLIAGALAMTMAAVVCAERADRHVQGLPGHLYFER